MAKITPQFIWSKYSTLQEYMTQHNYYDIVKRNEDFYNGKQWGEVESKSMPQPVFNVLKRVIKYFVATISTNDIAISMEPFSTSDEDRDKFNPIKAEVERVIEQAHLKEASRKCIRNGAVDGSAYMLQSFDPDFDTGQDMKGRVDNQIVDNTNVYFGNPYSNNIQKQPYIIIALRQHLSTVKDEAKQLGLNKDQVDSIQADSDYNQPNEDDADNLVTVLMMFKRIRKKVTDTIVEVDEMGNEIIIENEKEVNTVHFWKSTQNVMLIEDVDLGYKRYPISRFGWEEIKNSYLFTSPMTEVIPNQIFINKCFAIAQMYGMQSAFPKIVYDKNKVHIDKFMNTNDPVAVANIDSMGKFLDFIKTPDFSNNIMSLIDSTISQTKECMGANDVSLGNVKPDNTSAIIALQESSNVPLELQKQGFYEFWEDTIRNVLDIMSCTYGVREILTEKDGQTDLAMVDFSLLNNINYDLKVDIGNGAQFSEVSQINTLDKLLQNQMVTPYTYVDLVPSKYIPGKEKIKQELKERMDQQAQLEQMTQLQGN